MASYRKVNGDYALEERLGAPYALAARGLAVSLKRWKETKLHADDHWSIFAEKGTRHRGDMDQVFKQTDYRLLTRYPNPYLQYRPPICWLGNCSVALERVPVCVARISADFWRRSRNITPGFGLKS